MCDQPQKQDGERQDAEELLTGLRRPDSLAVKMRDQWDVTICCRSKRDKFGASARISLRAFRLLDIVG